MMLSSSVEAQGQPKPSNSKRATARYSNGTKNSGSVDANSRVNHHKEKDASLEAVTSSHADGAVSKAIQIVDSTTDHVYWDDSICSTTQNNSEHQHNSLFQTVSPISVKPSDDSVRIRAKKRELEQKLASWRVGISTTSKMGRRRSTGTACSGELPQLVPCARPSNGVFETIDVKHQTPSRVSRRHSMDLSPVKPRRTRSPSRSNRSIDGDESIISMLDFSTLRTDQKRDNSKRSHAINNGSSTSSVGNPTTMNVNHRASLRSMPPSPSISSSPVIRSVKVKKTSKCCDNKNGMTVSAMELKHASSKTLDTCGASSYGSSSSGGNAERSGEQHCLVADLPLDNSLPPLDPIYPDDDILRRQERKSLNVSPQIGGSASLTVSREPESMHSTTTLSEAGTIISVRQKDLEMIASHTARQQSLSRQQDGNRHTRPERRRSTGMGYDIARIHERTPVLAEHTDSFHLRPVEKKGSKWYRLKGGRQQRRSSTGGFIPTNIDIASPCPSRKTLRQQQRRNSTGCVPSSPSRSSSISTLTPSMKKKSTSQSCRPPKYSQTSCEVSQSSLDGKSVSLPRYHVASSESPASKNRNQISERRLSAGLPLVTGTTKRRMERMSSTGSSLVSGATNRSSFRRRLSMGSSWSKIELSTDDEADDLSKLQTPSKKTKDKKKDSKKSRRWSLSMFRLGHARSEE
mmetsp:Transcript_53955/g.131024  ORF Transcript_53955/g.131024 Transcript_53955/m.131024 type:complete len:689 (-) Transcript_53955:106-2172(-)|eukprot:CAMPEP_0113443406 /NCGR_PEP_ID=MMETSP0014_2-20120614/2123_1 /TAXON_ID=2857 /ORGANISM="Nitzschia sp." /LENGTH=688 /DNA_ID=CAMNT_0000334363 /DNA_START=287 /DNA_END=2353 /DNA_ORIENTATION=+ /assembly_acc=CAM_ASM_000159